MFIGLARVRRFIGRGDVWECDAMSGEKCNNRATFRRFWPGSEPDMVCLDHAVDSKAISQAMGFHLHMEPIGYPDDDEVERPMCCCSKGRVAEVNLD